MSSIYKVRDVLKETIKNKEQLLKEYETRDTLAAKHAKGFLEINVEELKAILADVEVCCREATNDSWAKNPDRMGGQFTDDEINNSTNWI